MNALEVAAVSAEYHTLSIESHFLLRTISDIERLAKFAPNFPLAAHYSGCRKRAPRGFEHHRKSNEKRYGIVVRFLLDPLSIHEPMTLGRV